ncbi:MAG TPA: 2-dehydro-3-deoxygalactonokinase [Steroidobacteraceae bacterium]|jgi:2-dehydro-3-deoxygalactonokinase|nr:2-dehydro-3-deoxygalactonokinase [Steroidobacteraceae bacterium]
MTFPAAFIAVDWGTSNARFALCDEDGQALETREGPGAAQSRGRFDEVFDEATAGWRAAHRELPAFMCGMVGSAFGWKEAPYLPCPADLYELADSAVKIREGVHVLPGMRCTNPLGAPDVMRGEETQLFGAQCMGLLPGERQLVCMPGTHTKWVTLSRGVVQEFLTAPTGEVFGLLCEHSVLVRDKATPVTHDARDFERGLAEAVRHPGALIHQVFQARSLRLDKQLSNEGAASWISGLLIGADVGGALKVSGAYEREPVLIIGAPHLADSYALALARHGRKATKVDGSTASLAGLAYVFREHERAHA